MTKRRAFSSELLRRSNMRVVATRVGSAALVLLALTACGGGNGDGFITRQQCTVSSVSVSPGTATVLAGDQTTLQAVPTMANCTTTPSTTWSSSAPSVASVSGSGVVTALTPGTATITATVASASGTSLVTVQQRPCASIFLPPASPIQVGQTLNLQAQPRDDRGQSLTGRTVTYSSSANAVATVSSAGVVTAVGPGTTTITVTCEAATATIVITVTTRPPASVRIVSVLPGTTVTPNTTTQATASVLDALGNVLPNETVTWASVNTNVATISATGLVRGVAPGQAVIRATSVTNASLSKDTLITVNNAVPVRVTLTLGDTIKVSSPATATATAFDAAGNVVPNVTFTWTSSNTGVANVSAAGVVTGVTPGTTTITASAVGFPGVSASKAIIVVVPVATVNVAQSNVLLEPGPNAGLTSAQLIVTLRDAAGNVLTGRTITYQSSNTAVATVSATGLVSAVGVGTGTITVSSEGVNSAPIPVIVARAFAVVDAIQPTNTSSYQPPQINSAGSTSTIQRTSIGQYRVTINGIGVTNQTIGRSITALVSATNSGINSQLLAPTAMCNMTSIDPNGPTIVLVACNDPVSLALKDAAFKLVLVGDNSVGGTGTGASFTLHETANTTTYTPRSAFSWNSSGLAMTVTPGFGGASTFGGFQVRHAMGITPGYQYALVGALASVGETCEAQAQTSSAQFTDVVCFDRNGPISAVHTVLRLSSGRPGQVGGLAFLDASNGANSGQGFNSGNGSVITSRTGPGKYTVVFGGMVATGTVGVIATPWGASGWAACSHYVVSLNPVTIDVSCFNSAGAFTNAGGGLTVLVLQ